MGVFDKTINPLALVGYEMIIANSASGIIVQYNPYRYTYVPPQRVWFLRRFGLKKGIDFVHFGLESDIVFEGTIREYMNVYVVSIPSGYRKEQVLCKFESVFKKLFCWRSNLSNDDTIS